MEKSIEERVTELEKIVKNLSGEKCVKISKNLSVGDTFQLADLTWKILDITEKGYLCLADRLPEDMEFGGNNDWKESTIREYLNGEFFKILSDAVGEENIIPFERNLISLDGQTEYGACEDKVSLISFDEYRKYRSLIPNTGDYYWWTLTPDSTKCNDDTRWVRVVSPSGHVHDDYCRNSRGVRPVCIFLSLIFES